MKAICTQILFLSGLDYFSAGQQQVNLGKVLLADFEQASGVINGVVARRHRRFGVHPQQVWPARLRAFHHRPSVGMNRFRVDQVAGTAKHPHRHVRESQDAGFVEPLDSECENLFQ